MHITIIHTNYVATYNGHLRSDVFAKYGLERVYSTIIEHHVKDVHEKQMIPYPEFILVGKWYALYDAYDIKI